jgi:hypothetical protein
MPGRSSGPLRSYTVSCAWPTSPKRYRVTVDAADEETARESVAALLRMHFAVRVDMVFRAPDRGAGFLGRIVAARWDQSGCVTDQHIGRFQEYLPGWVSGRDPVERERSSEPVLCGS